MRVGLSDYMKFKLIITLFIAATMLFITSITSLESSQKELPNKSNIILDEKIEVFYDVYTDKVNLPRETNTLEFFHELEDKRKKIVFDQATEDRNTLLAKQAEEKRIAKEKKISEEKRIAEIKRKEEAKLAEEKRLKELARIAEEKRLAALETKRLANKAAKESKKKVVASRGSSANYVEAYYEITAYTAGFESTGKRKGDPNYGLTASGAYVQQGVSLACPPAIPFGTKINIEGYGTRVCVDRGAHIQNNRLDIYMESLSDAQNFGRRTLKVKIYK